MRFAVAAGVAIASATSSLAVLTQTYTWNNVKIGGGGGFVPGMCRFTSLSFVQNEVSHLRSPLVTIGIVFNPGAKGVAFARTDIVSRDIGV